MALYDLLGKCYGAPLYVLLGGLVRKEITVIKMVSVGSPMEMARECRELVGEGYRALKLKVRGEVGLDLARVTAVRDAVGPDIFIKVDANEAFDAKSAIRMAAGMAELGVSVFEQPLSRHHEVALAEVKAQSSIKIEADQSASSVHEAFRLIRDNACDSINTGILKAGGVQQVRQITDMCALTGTECGLSNIAACMVGDAACCTWPSALPACPSSARSASARASPAIRSRASRWWTESSGSRKARGWASPGADAPHLRTFEKRSMEKPFDTSGTACQMVWIV